MGQGLFLSKNEKCFTDIDDIRMRGNEASYQASNPSSKIRDNKNEISFVMIVP